MHTNRIPDYFKEMRMVLLGKNRWKEASLDETRPILIDNNLLKIVEKAIEQKIEELDSDLLGSKSY